MRAEPFRARPHRRARLPRSTCFWKSSKTNAEITRRAKELTARQAALWQEDIRPRLAEHNIEVVDWEDLDETQTERLTRYFRHQIYPVLTPLAVDPSHPFPYISGLSLNLAVLLRNPRSGKEHFARLKVPASLLRLVTVPGRELKASDKAMIEIGRASCRERV